MTRKSDSFVSEHYRLNKTHEHRRLLGAQLCTSFLSEVLKFCGQGVEEKMKGCCEEGTLRFVRTGRANFT